MKFRWALVALSLLIVSAAALYCYGESLNEYPEYGPRRYYGLFWLSYVASALGFSVVAICVSISTRRWVMAAGWGVVLLCIVGRYSFKEQFYYTEALVKGILLDATYEGCRDRTGVNIIPERGLSLCHVYVEYARFHFILKDPSGQIVDPGSWSLELRAALKGHGITRDLEGCAFVRAHHLFQDLYYLRTACG